MPGRPSIRPVSTFHPDGDAEALRQAMKGMGTDEGTIIEILANRSALQRKHISSRYLALYGTHLEQALKSELTGHFETVVLSSLLEGSELNAKALADAMKGIGTNERVLIQVLTTSSNAEIKAIKDAFTKHVERDLEKDIASETSGDFQRILISLLQAQRDESSKVDKHLVEADSDALYDSGEGRRGTEETRFIQILSQRSFAHIKKIAEFYAQKYQKTLIDAIKKETSGNFCDALVAIVSFAEDGHALFAKWLHDSMAGAGTKDSDLIRLILTRAEIDLGDIKDAYNRLHSKLLTTAIESETSGDYRAMLMAITKGNA